MYGATITIELHCFYPNLGSIHPMSITGLYSLYFRTDRHTNTSSGEWAHYHSVPSPTRHNDMHAGLEDFSWQLVPAICIKYLKKTYN